MPQLTQSQLRFLALHARTVVERWQWHFQEAQLRAHAATRSATICRDELADLIERGLMYRLGGSFAVYPTTHGKELVA
jgi:hypothetical protein